MSNRVEELESQVAELQAAVDGLTEELVETRERLRQLEENDGVDNSRTPERRESAHAQVEHAPEDADDAAEADADDETETDTQAEAEEAEDDGSDSDGNDIIVA
ncbi:chromosome segregation protein SMC [Haloplanus rubicundus]|uniref:Chromosome segregation protein SMC n=1 Tax=Haloplanus rubicundus TaxID=1547898 RepID=A0A345E1R7_9EURY|nr:chromosome segregation protein SMC [Haloplanus rubicundus]AXG06139.1 chromosome segregation protein SMC [Haloplanus rubicundus]AXG09516.1 chromosome segregation protein SMC [Haloplanus rubicundus]